MNRITWTWNKWQSMPAAMCWKVKSTPQTFGSIFEAAEKARVCSISHRGKLMLIGASRVSRHWTSWLDMEFSDEISARSSQDAQPIYSPFWSLIKVSIKLSIASKWLQRWRIANTRKNLSRKLVFSSGRALCALRPFPILSFLPFAISHNSGNEPCRRQKKR